MQEWQKWGDTIIMSKMNNAEVIQVGNLYPDTPRFKNRTTGRVYDAEGISPTINTCQGGGKIPMIVVYEDRQDDMFKQQGGGVQPSLQDRIYDVEGCSTAITTSFLPNIAEPIICAMRGRNPDNPSERTTSNGRYRQRLEMNDKGTSNTITSVQKDNLVVEPRIIEVCRVKEGKHQQDMVQHEEGICRCICTGHHGSTPHLLKTMVSEPMCSVHPNSHKFEFNSATSIRPIAPALRATDYKAPHCVYEPQVLTPAPTVEYTQTPKLRIRKLTVREVFRLMGVDDADIDKIQGAGISNSQQYKMAGNSIVVDTLYYILRKLFVDKGCEKDGHQQTLF